MCYQFYNELISKKSNKEKDTKNISKRVKNRSNSYNLPPVPEKISSNDNKKIEK